MLSSPAAYRAGHEANFYFAAETAAYPSGVAAPNPALPGSVVWGGWATIPEVTEDEGTKEIYGLGDIEAQTIIPGARTCDFGVTTRLGNKALLQKCFLGGGGYRDLPDLCLVAGNSDIRGDGSSQAARFAKCASVSIQMSNGSAQEITAQTQFQALTSVPAAAMEPTAAELLAQGVPLTWHNVMEINVAGTNVRDVCTGVTLNVQYTLARELWRPDYGPENPWSRTAFAIVPKRVSYSASLQFQTPDVAREVLGLLGSATYTDGFNVLATTAGSSTEGNAAVSANFSAAAGRIKDRKRNGGEPDSILSGMVNLTLIKLGVS